MKSKILIKFFEEGGEQEFYKLLKATFRGLLEFFKNYFFLIILLLKLLFGLLQEIYILTVGKFVIWLNKK